MNSTIWTVYCEKTLQETATEIPHTLDAYTKKNELVSVPNLIRK